MTNFEKLKDGNKNTKLFYVIVNRLSGYQGFYGRLIRDINEMEPDEFEEYKQEISEHNFDTDLDVILWLET